MERVELLLLLILALVLCYSRVESGGDHFDGKLKERCSDEDRDALLNFKQSLFYPQLLSNWDISDNCCSWKGVGCNITTGNVIKVDLSDIYVDFNWTLAGNKTWKWYFYATSFDPSLFRLQHLQYLCLSGISFNNTSIPQSINSLTNLRYLDLAFTGLVGVIPPQLGNLTNLQYLDLSWNFLTASNLLWMSHLSSLQYLDMTQVDLALAINWLHEIMILPSLSMLILNSCKLQTLPILLPYSNFSSTIKTFDIFKNQFPNATIPSWLFNMTNLVVLTLSFCQLRGSIPNNIFGSTYKLEQLDLSNNLIDGSIPQWIGNVSNLKHLDLAYNRLTESIPYNIGQLTNLRSLELSNNQLHGNLSNVHFVKLSQLKMLDLSNNRLDFNMINPNWAPPFQVRFLSLRSCHIGPNFPSWLKTQKFLIGLDLSNGGISDIIPSWFWNIFSQIYSLNMSHNTIRGELPMSLNTASQVRLIDLSSNLLEGHIPQLMRYTNVALFSDNKFSKGIEWYLNASMSDLEVLDLSQNQLYGDIPDSICQMPSIIQLDLSQNNLSGEIPKCKGNNSSLMTLKYIYLSNNNFKGSVPYWIGNLPRLLSLHLSNNNFQGEISFLGYCNELIVLDLGQNKLTGNIPLWIGDRLLSLKILRLRSNKLYGSIPSNLSKLKGLQILDLADNFLSETLPKSFKLLNSMTMPSKRLQHMVSQEIYISDSLMIIIKGVEREFKQILSLVIIMDLSCNYLTGKIPVELMSLFGLRSLNLSHNQFMGQIPNNIGFMKSLESLDLSNNHFSGEIPESIAMLSGLSYLNLSYNQLVGRIPEGTQLDTFHESSYYGNLELCGKPLPKTCEHTIYNGASNSDDDDDDFGLFLGMSIGFVVGLWSVLGILLFKKSWAIAYFQLYHNITDNIYVFIVVKVNRWLNQ